MTTHAIAGTLLVAGVHFVSVALGTGLLLAPLVALLAFAFWRIVQPEETGSTGYVRVSVMTGAGTLAGAGLAALAGLPAATGWVWAAVPLATGVAAAIYSLGFGSRQAVCQLCRTPTREGASAVCPRCQDRVCSRPGCWNAKYLRCARCHEREVVVLPMHEQWWRLQFGRKTTRGQCGHCYKEAHETDLYSCGECAAPLCRRCWDYHNGQCPRCQWLIPNLPGQLLAHGGRAAGKAGHAARSPSGGRAQPGLDAAPPRRAARGAGEPPAAAAPARRPRPARHDDR
jgi:hypothetical protein